MWNTIIKWLVAVSCLAMLSACGGDSPEGAQSPTDRYTGGSGNSSGGSGGDGGGSEGPSIVKIGNGTGANFTEGVVAAPSSNLQAGASTEIVVNLVNGSNSAIQDELEVSFSSDCFANALASFSETTVQTSSGRASVTYAAQGCSGTDTVVATATADGATLLASVDLSIETDEVLSVSFESAEPEQLALKGMGSGETSRVTFKLVGEQGAAIRNELVTFSLNTTAGGISLAPDTDGDPTSETVTSDNSGLVSVVVQSGTVATTIRVTATHNTTGIQGSSRDLVISSGVPIQSKFSLAFEPQAPAAAHGTNGIQVSVSIIASDQFGNDVFDGTRVSFWSRESGNIDSSCAIESGECTVSWISAGERPADGRATFIAFMNGAEDFVDIDGDDVFDEGEQWTDLSEAYADHNENGTHDSGEPFIDVTDANPTRGAVGAWDSKGNLPEFWDGPCLSDFCSGESSVTVWRNGVIIHSLPSATIFVSDGVDGDGCAVRGEADPQPGTPLDLSTGPKSVSDLYVGDTRPRDLLPCNIIGNPMASGTTIEYSTDNGTIKGNASWTVPEGIQQAYFIGTITLEADDDPSDGYLTLTITSSEDGTPPTIFEWPVTD